MPTVDSRFPFSIHALWFALKGEVMWLHGRWIIYRQLFGTSPDRVDILNRSASTFFNVLQKTMLYDVQLSLSKLGDPAGSGTRRNLTLAGLSEHLEAADEVALCAKLTSLIDKFGTTCKELRHRRNRSIAHFDLTTILASTVTPLQGPSRDEIESALEALREVMNCVELHYTESQTAYEHFTMNQDGDYLISTLKQGLRYRELVRERVIAHDDLRKNFK